MADRILIAEDTGSLRETLAEVLTQQGYEVVQVGDGASAETQLTEGGFALAVLDMLLPKKQGTAVLEALKFGGSVVPVIVMSGVFKQPAQVKDIKDKYGVKDYLIKPFDNGALVTAVNAALGKNAPVATAAVAAATAAAASASTAEAFPASGTLAEHPAALLMFRIQLERQTGVLDLAGDKDRMRLFFHRGSLSMAQSSREGRHVGTELVAQGVITPQTLMQALATVPKESVGLYKVLLNHNVTDEARAKEAYKALAPKILVDAVGMTGRFKWTATEAFLKLIPTVSVPVLPLLFDAFKILSGPQLDALLEKKKSHRLAKGPLFDRFSQGIDGTLGSEVGRAINGRARLLQIVGAAQTPDARTARLAQAFALLCTQSALAVAEDAPAGAGATPSNPAIAVAAAPPPPAMEALDPEPLDEALDPVPVQATAAPAVARVYNAAAAQPAPRANTGGFALPSPAGNTSRPPAPAAAQPPVNVPADLKPILAEAEQRFLALGTQNHFEVLGVQRTDDAATIKKQYFALAGRFHTDKFSGLELGDARGRVDAVFARIAEAYDVLSKPEKRQEYDAELRAKDSGMQTNIAVIFEAESQFTKGETVLMRGDFISAKKLFDQAMDLDPKDLYRAYQLYAGFMCSSRSKGLAVPVIAELEKLGTQTTVPRLNEFLGIVAKAAENWSQAKTYFKRVLEEPQGNKAVAQREIALIDKKMMEMKGGGANTGADKAGEKGGLMGKLFKS